MQRIVAIDCPNNFTYIGITDLENPNSPPQNGAGLVIKNYVVARTPDDKNYFSQVCNWYKDEGLMSRTTH